MKSITDSVPLMSAWDCPVDTTLAALELDIASDVARNVKASIRSGNDDLRQRPIDSRKVIKTPNCD